MAVDDVIDTGYVFIGKDHRKARILAQGKIARMLLVARLIYIDGQDAKVLRRITTCAAEGVSGGRGYGERL